jgi:DNA-binding NtrC family response regulator
MTDSSSESALKTIIETKFSCILLDVKMPGLDGIELLKKIIGISPDTAVIMISGQSNIETAVNAVKIGAFDFIEKPINPERLLITIKNAIEKQKIIKDNERLSLENNIFKRELEQKYHIVGFSPEMKKIFKTIETAANVDAKVLITGDSGTGKELIAWAIHHNSKRRLKPYIRINCASIPGDLLESELFGYRKGAFTGAVSDKSGKFQAAEGGTLFLDEIGEMDIRMQAKLLRVLQENEIEILGDTNPLKINVRIIAATNKNLQQLIENGLFREDLYHRLDLIRIHVPPLSQRKDDILPLVNYFIDNLNIEYNKHVSEITSEAKEILLNHHWKGNIRELKNVIERIIIFSKNDFISAGDVLQALGDGTSINPMYDIENIPVIDIHSAHHIFEKQYIEYVLKKFNWKKLETAKALGIDPSNLYKKIKKHGLITKPEK